MHGQTIGGFQVARELGRGGMGIVYEAEQASPRRHVALKVLPPEFAHSPGVAARFEQEANRMAQLDEHPNIATVYASGEDNGTAYFAMQLLAGGDLEQRLGHQGRFDQREAAEIIAKVADALDHAHRQGIVHRDIKPANIMFNSQGDPVVTDFGIAQAADQVRMTMTGMSVCTPEYASPEQVKGNPVDGRSDLYSLGVVLYRMVTGRPLFDCGNPMTWAMKHISETPQPPSVWHPELSSQLQSIILKCLQKEPSERFANGHDLAQALRSIDWQAAALPQAPIVVPAPTVAVAPQSPALPLSRRPVWPYVVGGIGLAGLIVGIVLMAGRGPGDDGDDDTRGPTPTVNVPSVLGMPFETAKATLWNIGGLPIQMGEDRHDATYATGTVCSQHPVAGTQVERGDAVRVVVSKGPPPPPPPPPVPDAGPVRDAYYSWLDAWQSRDIDAYMACYAPDCQRGTGSAHARGWSNLRQKMQEVFAKNSFISISTGEPTIEMGNGTATVTAWQDYNSPTWHDSGTKHLIFVFRDGRWLIFREQFSVSSQGKGPR